MKNSPIDSPRFLCRLVRGSLSVFGDPATGKPRGPGASHLATCEDCREFFGACDGLTLALKRHAARAWCDAPAGLEQNILRAVNLAARETAPKLRTARGTWMPLAAVAACAVAAALVYRSWTPPGPNLPAPGAKLAANEVDPDALAAARAVLAAVPSDLLSQLQPKAQELLQQNPLQNEAEAIASDARKAVGFLARNFMPTPVDRPANGE